MGKVLILFSLVVALLLAPGALPSLDQGEAAAQTTAQETGEVTGLPLPRFVSLKSSEANMRSGPGLRYPIQWIYRREGLPVEVIAEFDTWRKLRDWEGTEGWMHQSMLSGDRTAMITGSAVFILRDPSPNARIVAQLETGVIVDLRSCGGEWCEVAVEGYRGWLDRGELYGLLPGESLE